MIKICFVTTLPITIKSFLLDFSDYLVKTDIFDVTFICNDDESLISYTGERIHFVPVKMKRGIGFDGIKVIRQLKKIFIENHFDIIQYSTPNAAFYASIAAKEAKCKNRLYCQWGIRYMGFSSFLPRLIFKTIEKKVCRNSTIIEVESYSLLQFGLKEKLYDANKASVIGSGSACGVNLKKYNIVNKQRWRLSVRDKLSIPSNAIVFGYAGRITREKGINELFEAFKRLDDNNAYLLLVGKFDNEGTIDENLKKWVVNNKRVVIVDWNNKIEEYYSAMDVFVSLSYREGFGLVVIEAAAMGVPSIVTNVPGQIDTINDKSEGILVNPKNVDDVVAAMKYYLNNNDKILEHGQRSRHRVEKEFEQNSLFELLTLHRKGLIK